MPKPDPNLEQRFDEIIASLEPGQTLTCQEIANRAGCSRAGIHKSEQVILRKLSKNKVLEQMWAEHQTL